MNKQESCQKKNLILFFFVTFLAVIVRYVGRDFISEDMATAFLPWYENMKNNGGLSALSAQIGDYGLLYQTIVALLTYIDINPVYLYKLLSVSFDFLMAVSISYFINQCGAMHAFLESDSGKTACVVYACVLLIPTVVLNSAFWGQCDSIYVFFLLWSVWFLYKEKYNISSFMLGLSLAFKLQAILIAPLFLYSYFSRKRFSILLNSVIAVFVFWFSGIIVYIYRHKVFDSIGIYSNQVTMFKRMWMNVPSFWVFVGDDYNKLHFIAIGLTFLILGFGLYMFVFTKLQMNSYEEIIGVAVFIEWTCILFLPAMHERYTYVMDILLLMLTFLNKKYLLFTFITIVTSTLSYTAYLFTNKGLSLWVVLIYFLAWVYYCYSLFIADKRTFLLSRGD